MRIVTTCAALATLTTPGIAANLTWNSPSPGGTWDTSTALWLDGASPATWNNATPDQAVFGATGTGAVALAAPVTAGSLTINAAGYSISGSTLTLAGATPTITTAADATISSTISGSSGLTKSGAALLDLTGANDYSGDTVVSAGTLKLSTPQLATGTIQVNSGTLAFNAGQNANGYRLTQGTAIHVATGAQVSMQVAFPWGWYANNNATGLTVNLSGGSFNLNNLHQGSFGVKAVLTGGSITGGGTSSRWELGRSGGFDGTITTLASATTSTITAGIVMMRPDSGQTNYPFAVAQGTTASGVDLEISSSLRTNGTVTLTKTGPGAMKLTGASTYTTPTVVSQGKLVLGSAAAFPSSPITLSPGALLDVTERTDFTLATGKTLVAGRTGTPVTDITGNLVVAGTLHPAGKGVTGALSLNGNLTLNGAAVNVDQAAGQSDVIRPTGSLTLTGTSTFSASDGYFPAGTYTLLSGYSSVSGAPANLAWGSLTRGQGAVFSVTPSSVQMTLDSGAPAALTWSGATGGLWDINTSSNWNGGADKFFQLDAVTFADAPANTTVTINGAVAPASIAFTNATSAYVVRGGTGSIIGTGSLVKSGEAAVSLWNNANTFSGGTVIQGGTIHLNSGAALGNGAYSPLGSGLVSINTGGTLQLNPGNNSGGTYTLPNGVELAGGTLFQDDGNNTLAGDLTVSSPSEIKGHYGGKNFFLGGTLKGSAALTVTDDQGYALYGAGGFHLMAAGTYDGTVTITTGHLVAQADDALRFAKVAVETAQGVDGWGNNVGFTLAGAASNVTIAGLSGGNANARVQNGDGTLRTLTIDSSATSIFAGAIGSGAFGSSNPNKLNVTKNGSGSLTLAGNNTYTGTTTVNGGQLVVQSSNSSLDYAVGSGAALGVNLNPTSPTLVPDGVTLADSSSVNILNFTGSTTAPAIDTIALTTSGTVTVNVAGTFTPGTFPLILSQDPVGGSGINAFVLGSLPRGIAAHLDTSDGQTVKLVVTGTNSLVWKGNLSSAWDVNTTANWTLGVVTEKFLNGDAVLFSNAAGANTAVALDTEVNPASVIVNSTNAYTITGTGSIGGAGGITKSGTGSVELGTANTFSGDVQILQGLVKLGDAAALGTTAGATLVADGGSLDLNGQTIGAEALSIAGSSALVNSGGAPASIAGLVTVAGPASISGDGDITLSSGLTGFDEVTKQGIGILSLPSTNSGFSGPLKVQGGVLRLLADRCLPNSSMTTIESGATVEVGFDNATRNTNQTTLVKSGGLLTVASGCTTNFGTNTGGASSLTLEGGAELGGSNPETYWGSWTINTVDRKIVIDGGAAQSAILSARAVTPDGAYPLRLAVSDVTGSADVDLLVTGTFGSEFRTDCDVEIDGGGTVEFATPHAHTGITKVLSGKLVLTSSNALTTASTLDLADGATLTLDFSGTQQVTTLVIDGVTMPVGTYGTGGTANAAISGSGTLEVLGSNPYTPWEALHGIAGEGAETDSDGDGIANGIEFVLGSDPSDSDSSGLLPTVTTNASTLTFVFRCREDALDIATVEHDADLADAWTTAVDGTGGVTIATDSGLYPNDPIDDTPVSRVTVKIPRSSATMFARLRASVPAAE
jgi:fibronectin-binding autotransporter adhesin